MKYVVGLAIGFIIAVIILLAMLSARRNEGKLSPCGHKVIKVSTSVPDGVFPETVVLCSGDTATWAIDDPTKVKDFRVEIDPKDNPFQDAGPINSQQPMSTQAKRLGLFNCYRFFKYTIVITDSEGTTVPHDPHGIIMGGP